MMISVVIIGKGWKKVSLLELGESEILNYHDI